MSKQWFWIIALAAMPLVAQEALGQRVTAKFADPSRPGTIRVELMSGNVTVKSHTGPEVAIEINQDSSGPKRRRREDDSEENRGLRKIITNSPFSVREEGNTITVEAESWQNVNITVMAPVKSNLKLQGTNSGFEVEGMQGEIEATTTNGKVILTSVAGPVVAHTVNGKLLATLTQVSTKPMSFTSFNGTVDVTLPTSTKATIKMSTNHGDIYTDFDMTIDPVAQTQVEESTDRRGRRKIVGGTTVGKINGGGPEIQFKTFNGNVYIRKGA